jgi:isopenicillin N synthase-like dioxygenase
LKESFRAGPESVRSDSYYQRLGADDYFFANIWPAQPTGLRTVWEVYYAVLDRLSREVMAAFALALDLNEQWFDDKIDYAISQLVALHYPTPEQPPLPGQFRSGTHTDFGSITLLLAEDKPGGLQVADLEGNWHDVSPIPGTYIVNVGDLMAQWTNDRWCSTLHRVVNPPAEDWRNSDRVSIAFFHQPNFDARIEAIPTCLGDRGSKYPVVTSGEHLRSKLNQTRVAAV